MLQVKVRVSMEFVNTFELEKLFTPESEALRYLPEGVQLINPQPGQLPEELIVGWVGIQHGETSKVGSINFLNLHTRTNTSFEMPGRPGFFVQTDTPGVFLTGLTDKLSFVDFRKEEPEFIQTDLKVSQNEHIINDGIVTSRGLLFGTKATKWLEREGELYLLPNGGSKLLTVKSNVQCSNGIVELEAEEDLLRIAYIDSPTKKLVELLIDCKSGASKVVRTIADFNDQDAFPDGMRAAPGEGIVEKVVIAFFNPLNPEYGVLKEIDLVTGKTTTEWKVLGAARVTCLAFVPGESIGGNANSVKIVVTTADEGTPTDFFEHQSNRGCIFIGDTNYNSQALVQGCSILFKDRPISF